MTDFMSPERMRRLRRLMWVPRWSATPTLRRQSVLEHSAAVMPIALWLVEFHATARYAELFAALLLHCLVHDEAEAISSDIPSPFKQEPAIRAAIKGWEDRKDLGVAPTTEIRCIVKVADCLEALVFVKEEMAMGNSTLWHVMRDIREHAEQAWGEFDWDEAQGPKWAFDTLLFKITAIYNPSIHPMMEKDAV